MRWSEAVVLETAIKPGLLASFWRRRKTTSERPKALSWKSSSDHNSLHFFDISSSKSAPRMAWFVHFDFDMCFACNFSYSSVIWPDVCAPAALASLLLDPLEPHISTNHWTKHAWWWIFYLFAQLHLLSSDSFSSLLFSSLTLLNPAFPSAHIVGSLEVWLLNFLPLTISPTKSYDHENKIEKYHITIYQSN